MSVILEKCIKRFKLYILTVSLVTETKCIFQALLYTGIIDVPWDRWDVCLSANSIWKGHEWRRLFLAAVEHSDDRHLFYNMVSFLSKAKTLEPRYGSSNFALLLVFLTIFTSASYVMTAMAFAKLLHDASHLHTCAIGFSGKLWALFSCLMSLEVLDFYISGMYFRCYFCLKSHCYKRGKSLCSNNNCWHSDAF